MNGRRLAVCGLFALLCGATPAMAALSPGEAASDSTLAVLRAARRGAVRTATAAAQARGDPAFLPLLVIPVDFSDARLPAGWSAPQALAGKLSGTASLSAYFATASAGRAELGITVAPLVRLPGARQDYSDVGLNGFTRTRRLATEALTAARDAGVTFRRFDSDGPDGSPGTADDDGEVDAVLILHSDTGDENAANAPIQALQYYLATPVLDRGTVARSYAVASLASGVGIWAHETAHLCGLEDRYDPYLVSSGGDLAGRGGLGVFSLMAAGAYGTGDADDPSLLDAYSAAQLGWADVVAHRGDGSPHGDLWPVAEGGSAWRVWRHGEAGPEAFLLETRAAAPPWDGALLGHQLIIYHLDEALPERAQSSGDPLTRHLRVALVEADGDGALRAGLDRGTAADVFPGSGGVTAWTPATTPSSAGYTGPSEVSITAIASPAGLLSFALSDAATPGFALEFAFAGTTPTRELSLRAISIGSPVTRLTADLVFTGPDVAAGGFTAGDSIQVELAPGWAPASPPLFTLNPEAPGRAVARFRVRLHDDTGFSAVYAREWVWRDGAGALDFAHAWPGDWTTVDRAPDRPGTAWQRWTGGGVPTGDGSPVLICTGTAFTTPAAWPQVSYANGADLALVSPPLDAGTGAVRLVHAIDGELERPGVAFDGGALEFLAGDGAWLPAAPIDGYGGVVAAQSLAGLHGRPAFAAEDSLTAAGPALWRVDVVPVPADAARPLRLALRFAADDRFRGRGWLIARLDSTAAPVGASAFPAAWLPGADWIPWFTGAVPPGRGSLAWDWPGEPAGAFRVDLSHDNGATWRQIYRGTPSAGAGGYAYAVAFDAGVPDAKRASPPALQRQDRYLFRVVAETAIGNLVSRARAFYPGGADGSTLGVPRPNPGPGPIMVAAYAATPRDLLKLCDLAGRSLRSWPLTAGDQTVVWDGRDASGRPLPSGSYFFVLLTAPADATPRPAAVRRAVLLH